MWEMLPNIEQAVTIFLLAVSGVLAIVGLGALISILRELLE
jgi:hypothetical protein